MFYIGWKTLVENWEGRPTLPYIIFFYSSSMFLSFRKTLFDMERTITLFASTAHSGRSSYNYIQQHIRVTGNKQPLYCLIVTKTQQLAQSGQEYLFPSLSRNSNKRLSLIQEHIFPVNLIYYTKLVHLGNASIHFVGRKTEKQKTNRIDYMQSWTKWPENKNQQS
jgi:hypothetical protein